MNAGFLLWTRILVFKSNFRRVILEFDFRYPFFYGMILSIFHMKIHQLNYYTEFNNILLNLFN